MLTAAEYFKQFTYVPLPRVRTRPVETTWVSLGTLQIASGCISIGDAWGYPYDAIDVEVVPGYYLVTAECFSYGTDGRVARLRALLHGATVEASEKVGLFSVDVACAGLSDGRAVSGFSELDGAGYEAWCESFVDHQCKVVSIAGAFECPEANVSMFFASTGFGDGTYTVVSLSEGGRVVGAEAEFLRPDHPYLDLYDP